ncbi:DUF2921 family protein [Melia azedarach]|uniref:DUF2921 family protein n=1 Tax=Melia azedarach TaxID=155640 RepID=A0ACC1YT30_MELAZ|nr:DUF2921 family protein [Melia azedarach]
MIMNSSSFPWFYTVIFSFLLSALCLNSSLTSATQISYADHCNSLVPESTLKRFRTPKAYKTDRDGVFGIEGNLMLRSHSTYYYESEVAYVRSYDPGTISHSSAIPSRRNSVRLRLHGFWSESSGNLCMVGRSYYSKQGTFTDLEVVFKLSNLKNSSSITTLVSGSLESLSSTDDLNYFEPISILILPRMGYGYTLFSKELSDEFPGGYDSLKSLPLSSLSRRFCSVVSRAVNEFNLKYTRGCSSAKSCSPFGAAAVEYLPGVVSLKQMECLEEEKKMRILIEFHNSSYVGYYQPFDFNKTLVGEGFWDDKTNQLYVLACRFLNTAESLVNASTGDCTTRLSLSYPAIWSIGETSTIVGRIWSEKAVNDRGYFDKILFRNSENSFGAVSGLKYEYTETNRARKLCWLERKPGKNKGKKYPNGHSYDMQFNLRVKIPNANSSRGYATPVFVDDQFYQRYLYQVAPSGSGISTSVVGKFNHNTPVNISYKIGVRLLPGVNLDGHLSPPDISRSSSQMVEISAEGIYDAETGQLCMVGCRNTILNNHSLITDSMDCEILINFQFPPSNPKNNEGYIKGSIKSMRGKSDPLYFEPLDVFSISYSAVEVIKSISRIDWEIVMALISNTIACLLVGFQLFHVKRHPEALPSISLVMLLLLILGHMIPLVLNFEALFFKNYDQQNALLSSGGWLEGNEVLVRIIMMVAFLLEFRLLQLVWSAKLAGDEDKTGLWCAEQSTFFLSLSLYAIGALIFLPFNRRNLRYDIVSHSSPHTYYLDPQSSLWGGLKSYAGFILDGFLLPQILFNIFWNSKENALSSLFYIGTTSLRVLAREYYDYNINSNYFSDTCNVVISLVSLAFAAIVFLQQRFGSRFIVPMKFGDANA